jgi:hypothetical protein
MNRTLIVVVSAVLVLTCSDSSRGQENFDPALKKLMPKDQLEFVEKMEALNTRFWSEIPRIKDATKRGEFNEQLGSEAREIQAAIVKKLQTEGVKDWVGTCCAILPNFRVNLESSQPIRLSMPLHKKPSGEIEKAVSSIKINDIVRFSTKADPSYVLPRMLGKTYAGFDQLIKTDSMTSVATIGTRPSPSAAKPPVDPKQK